jgi:hypothetical protein
MRAAGRTAVAATAAVPVEGATVEGASAGVSVVGSVAATAAVGWAGAATAAATGLGILDCRSIASRCWQLEARGRCASRSRPGTPNCSSLADTECNTTLRYKLCGIARTNSTTIVGTRTPSSGAAGIVGRPGMDAHRGFVCARQRCRFPLC